MEHVLIVEDSQELSRCIRWTLADAGLGVSTAASATDARERLATSPYDLLILDLMLPDGEGLDLCRQFRAAGSAPTLVVSARGNGADRMLALEAGADMYMAKPLDLPELLCRVQTCLRLYGANHIAQPLVCGDLRVDRVAHSVRRNGTTVALTPKEYDLLEELMRNAGGVCRSEELLWRVWGYTPAVRTRTLDVHVGRLRAKLHEAAVAECAVVTVPGIGYRLEVPAALAQTA